MIKKLISKENRNRKKQLKKLKTAFNTILENLQMVMFYWLDDTLKGSVAYYFCNVSFRLAVNIESTCQPKATWLGTVPTCICE